MVIGAAAAAGIATVALGLVLTPGPNMLYLVSRSITQGRRAGLVSLLGVAAGFGVYLAAASAGIASVFAAVPAAYLALKIAGAGYLLYLAVRTLRAGGRGVFEARDLPVDPPWRLFTAGLTTNLLNPKIAVLYVALLPQFVDPAGAPVWEQSLALGAVQIVVALTVNALIVCSAATLARVLGRRPSWVRVQRWVMGGVLGALAVRLLAERAPAPAQ
ncbi:LysE family translocator [Pseudonocardia benzenivorans]|jgi:threonine/homoserine/homoserine lactone efflux protein|uniref:LysE family translocator n=1 Tax=Pseudonocardia benzenivorans TaxID=228005 RepID=A0ABW3VEE7_9PSEU|nr:lysine transporter LysE [Pseudonocardia sp. D17]